MEALNAETREFILRDPDVVAWMPVYFSSLNLVDEGIRWVERAVERDFINYPFLAHFAALENLRRDERFQKILRDVKRKWESCDIPGML